jgi:hypothetical protein
MVATLQDGKEFSLDAGSLYWHVHRLPVVHSRYSYHHRPFFLPLNETEFSYNTVSPKKLLLSSRCSLPHPMIQPASKDWFRLSRWSFSFRRTRRDSAVLYFTEARYRWRARGPTASERIAPGLASQCHPSHPEMLVPYHHGQRMVL